MATVFEDVPSKVLSMYEEENRDKLRENVVNAKEYFKIQEKNIKMENELRFLKLDFAKMVLAKEEALSQLASAKLVLIELKAEVEKMNLADYALVVVPVIVEIQKV